MPNPFSGIDPCVEDQGLWPDFHASFLVACRKALLRGLSSHYDARIEERLTIDRLRPLGLPLAPDDLAWAEATARGGARGQAG